MAEDIICRMTADRLEQYDQAASRFRYDSICRQIIEYLKEPILSADGALPDKEAYREQVAHDVEKFSIDSSYVAELRKEWENRTIHVFDNIVYGAFRDNANAYVKAVVDRKLKQYDRVADAIDALNNKAELAREKEALEKELSRRGIFAGKRKKEIRALLEAVPAREASIISKGNQAISDADSPCI